MCVRCAPATRPRGNTSPTTPLPCTYALQEQATVNLTRTAYKVLQQPGAQPAEPAAGAAAAGAQPNGIAAGDEEGEDAAGGSSGEEEEGEEDPELDAFDPEAAAKLEALTEAVQDPGAFLQPSAEVGGPAGGHGGGG